MHELKGLLIEDMPEEGIVRFSGAVQRKDLRFTRTQKQYLNVVLADRTGTIDCRAWDNVDAISASFQQGDVVRIEGTVDKFRDDLQVKVGRLFRLKPEQYNLADLLPASQHDPGEMFAKLEAWVGCITDPDIQLLVQRIVADHCMELKSSPAAVRMHHAYASGLIEHILSMLGAADQLCRHYSRLDRSLLLAGCILHDIGKIRELKIGLTFEYSTRGYLLGHIGEGLLLIERYAPEGFPERKKELLQHLVASHHGEMEFGALKLPAIPEALALHFIDQIDAKLNQVFGCMDRVKAGEWTDWVPGMHRRMYVGGTNVQG